MTLRSNSMANDTHEYCWKMLPWFVTGRLSPVELQRVEQHITECGACRAELEEQRELCMHIRRDESVLLAPQASLQKMMARIEGSAEGVSAEEAGGKYASAVDSAKIVGFPATRSGPPRSYRWLAIAAAVQTVAIAGLLTLVWHQTSDVMTAPRFTTLSSPAVPAADGALLRVVFNPESPTSRVQALLHSVNAQVVAGPTEAGVYTLRLDSTPDTAEVSRALSQVRADGAVVFAEHISAQHHR